MIATDGSTSGTQAANHAVGLARELSAELHALAVVADAPMTRDRIRANQTTEMEEALTEIREVAENTGVMLTTEIRDGDPCSIIVEYAEELGVDLLVMGVSAGSRLNNLFYGSTTQCVEEQANVPVLVVGGESQTQVEHTPETTLSFHCQTCESTLNVSEETREALLDNGCVLCGGKVTEEMLRVKEVSDD